MSNETCPHCGAEKEPPYNAYGLEEIEFVCGNTRDIATKKSSSHLSQKCYQRQLAQKDAEIERLLKLLKDIGDYAHDNSTAPAIEDGYWEIRRLAYDEF